MSSLDEKLAKAVGGALRPPEISGVEWLIGSEISTAAFSEPVESIRHIIETFFELSPSQAERLEIDAEALIIIHKLAIAFLSARFSSRSDGVFFFWPFPRSEAERYLGRFDGVPVDYVVPLGSRKEEWREYLAKLPKSEALYILGERGLLSRATFHRLRSFFIATSLPTVRRYVGEVFRKLIRPDTAELLAEGLRKGRKVERD